MAKVAGVSQRWQVDISSRNQSNVYPQSFLAAQTFEFTVLDHPQQLLLNSH